MGPFIVLLAGLEGSGKSQFSRKLRHKLAPCESFSDYLRSTHRGVADAEDYKKLARCLAASQNCILDDVSWCEPAPLERAHGELKTLAPRHSILTVYFENDPEQCRANALRRNGDIKHDMGWIAHRTTVYEIPEPLPSDAALIPVWGRSLGRQGVDIVLEKLSRLSRR